MSEKKILPIIPRGTKVVVDRSGSGDAYQFLTIKDSYETNNCNGYKDYDFEELEARVSEYYIRKRTAADEKFKKLYDKLNIKDFEIDDDEIKRSFWESQEENIASAKAFMLDFLHPYLTEFKHVLPVHKMTNWDAVYKKAMHTKNEYIFTITHDILKIIVIKTSTWVKLYILAPDLSCNYFNDIKKIKEFDIYVFTFASKYSDDEYTQPFIECTKAAIESFENGLKRGYYHVSLSYEITDKLSHYNEYRLKGNYNDWSESIPSEYVRDMFDLGCIRYYFFNKGFR